MESQPLLRWLTTGAAALAFAMAPTAILTSSNVSTQADGCYNGVTRLNPYASSCTLPGPVKRSAALRLTPMPASLARHQPGCLASYVNGP